MFATACSINVHCPSAVLILLFLLQTYVNQYVFLICQIFINQVFKTDAE